MGHNIGRNDPCPCGSGKKYKKCCLLQDEEKQQSKIEDKPAISRKNLYNNKDYDDLNTDTPSSYDQEVFDDDERPSSIGIADQYVCRQFEREIPDIGGDQQKIIEGWVSQYKKITRKDETNPSLIKDHIVRFLDQHPDLAVHLAPDDIIFSLETDYLRNGNYDEFVAFLKWYRDGIKTISLDFSIEHEHINRKFEPV